MWLDVKNLKKNYQNNEVLKDINFSLEKGKTLAILGKSGCGKTTLLKVLAGIEQSDEGSVYCSGKPILHLPLNQRNLVYLFQEPLIFPHLNVFDNIAFGLKVRKVTETEIKSRTHDMIEALELSNIMHKTTYELSGGQKQRVAFGRSLIINPDCLLLDEPFSSLDFQTRSSMQIFYKDVSARFNITTIFVTHDLKESIIMGDQFATMDSGILKLYTDKQEFINSPETGVLQEKTFWDNINP